MLSLDESYRILGVGPGASAEELKKAYRKKTKAWHPDLFFHDTKARKKAEEHLRQIIRANAAITAFFKNGDLSGTNGGQQPAAATGGKSGKRGGIGAKIKSSTWVIQDKILACSTCGRLNRIDELDDPYYCYCWECKNPLGNTAGTRVLAPKPFDEKKVKFWGIGFPSLDYVKFLGFCIFLFTFLTVACIGTAFLIWGGMKALIPQYFFLY